MVPVLISSGSATGGKGGSLILNAGQRRQWRSEEASRLLREQHLRVQVGETGGRVVLTSGASNSVGSGSIEMVTNWRRCSYWFYISQHRISQ